MMSENIDQEFIKTRDYFSQIGFEVVGTKEVNDEKIILIKRKRKNY